MDLRSAWALDIAGELDVLSLWQGRAALFQRQGFTRVDGIDPTQGASPPLNMENDSSTDMHKQAKIVDVRFSEI